MEIDMDLAYYTARAKNLSTSTLLFALRDVTDTIAIYRDRPLNDPYVAKLFAEFDAYIVELAKRRRG
jgi:hypothetical protein